MASRLGGRRVGAADVTAARVLDVARREIGTVESPPGSNRTKYGAAYGANGVAWCAQFVWWVFREAGLSSLIPKTAYTPTFAQWFKSRGQWGTAPRPGAVVFFDFPNDGVDRISHVGLVEAVNRDGSIVTIEGNTPAGTGGSQRDGGGVWRRTRKAGVVGYGYPAYPAPAEEDDLTPDQDRLLREVHSKLYQRHPNRVDFGLLGAPRSDAMDDIGGFAINADARAFETRQLVLELRHKVDEIAQAVAQAVARAVPTGASGPVALTDEDVRRIATETVAEITRDLRQKLAAQ